MNIVSEQHPLKHYQWGEQCDGFNFVDEESLSVKLERMPPGSAEQKHLHLKARQFFYILKGSAVFEIENQRFELSVKQGIHILPGNQHRILNETNETLEFLLSSQPSTSNDRINCE